MEKPEMMNINKIKGWGDKTFQRKDMHLQMYIIYKLPRYAQGMHSHWTLSAEENLFDILDDESWRQGEERK